jgi:hypothetical protein
MTEFEILYLLSEHNNRIWEIIQFWTGVSFGLIAVAHVAKRVISKPIAIVLSMLYTAFSMFLGNMLLIITGLNNALITDLTNLPDTAVARTQIARLLIQISTEGKGILLIITAMVGTFMAALFILWHAALNPGQQALSEQEPAP